MNKEYYNNLIKEEIKYLLEKERTINEEIADIATIYEYHDIKDNVDLNRLDISTINKKRQQTFAITELIFNLDKLIKEVE